MFAGGLACRTIQHLKVSKDTVQRTSHKVGLKLYRHIATAQVICSFVIPTSPAPLAPAVRGAWICAAIVAALLASLGLLMFPAALAEWQRTLPGLAAVIIALSSYALLGAWGAARLERVDRRLLRLALVFGLVVAAIYATEILLEYVLLPRDNTRYGVVEFGLVFLSHLTAGFIAALQTRLARNGLMAAVGSALISTLLWYIVLLAITYAMKGTPRQAMVFRAEGDLDDFAHSGSANFEAWLMQDLLGAGFYHLLLGLIIAAILGGVGGLVGRLLPARPGSVQAA